MNLPACYLVGTSEREPETNKAVSRWVPSPDVRGCALLAAMADHTQRPSVELFAERVLPTPRGECF